MSEEVVRDPECDELEEYDEVCIPIAEDALVVLDGPQRSIMIGDRLVYYREGCWMEQDEKGEFYADWGLTWFYEDPECPEEYLYYEQDPPEVAVNNLAGVLENNSPE